MVLRVRFSILDGGSDDFLDWGGDLDDEVEEMVGEGPNEVLSWCPGSGEKM